MTGMSGSVLGMAPGGAASCLLGWRDGVKPARGAAVRRNRFAQDQEAASRQESAGPAPSRDLHVLEQKRERHGDEIERRQPEEHDFEAARIVAERYFTDRIRQARGKMRVQPGQALRQ